MAEWIFNAEEVEPSSALEPIPTDWYTAIITESEWKETKSGTGEYLALTFEIVEGPHENRKIWANLNLKNQNPTAVKIANQDLSAICRAVDVMQLTMTKTEALHFKKLEIRVGRQKDNPERNEVKGYRAVGSEGASKSASKSSTKAAPKKDEAPKSSTPPWKRAG